LDLRVFRLAVVSFANFLALLLLLTDDLVSFETIKSFRLNFFLRLVLFLKRYLSFSKSSSSSSLSFTIFLF